MLFFTLCALLCLEILHERAVLCSASADVVTLLDEVEDFYATRTSDAYRIYSAQIVLLNVAFNPPYLDFGEQPFSSVKVVEVTLTNLDSDHSFEIITTFGARDSFLWSRFNQTTLIPSASASFNVTFLPHRVGYVENTLYIPTSRGLLKYQTFGSAYLNIDSFIPTIQLELVSENSSAAVVRLYNPHAYPIEISDLGLCLSQANAVRRKLIISSVPEGCHHSNDCSLEPVVVHPHRSSDICTLDILTDDLSTVRGFLAIAIRFKAPDAGNSADFWDSSRCNQLGIINRTVAVSVHAHYTSSSYLFPQISLLHFGTVSTLTGPVTKQLQLINRFKHPLTVTRVEADSFEQALSIKLTDPSILSGWSHAQSVASITFSPQNISHSYELSGFITAYTNVKSVSVKVPYVVKLVHGSFATKTLLSSVWVENEEHADIRFQYFIQNNIDLPLSVKRPDLSRSVRDMVAVHNRTCTTELYSGEELLLFSLSIRNPSRTRVTGTFRVSTNLSSLDFSIDLFSGHLNLFVENARLISGTYDFGTVLVGQQRNSTISVYNGNPVEISIATLLITTVHSEEAAWIVAREKQKRCSKCVANCHLIRANRTCNSCVKTIDPYSSTQYTVYWGGLDRATTVNGFIILQSSYHRLIRRFRFYVAVGELALLPNPISVHDIFPGKVVSRNVIVQSSFPTSTELSRFKLETDSDVEMDSIRLLDGRSTLPRGVLAEGPMLSANRPTIVGSVLFDPALDCTDMFSRTSSSSDMGVTSEHKNHRTICYSGFSLESDRGSEWFRSMTRNSSLLESEPEWIETFRSGLLQSASTYAALKLAWSERLADSSSRAASSVRTLEARVSLSVSGDESVFWGDLSAFLVWPRLVLSRKSSPKKTVSSCILQSESPAGTDLTKPFPFGEHTKVNFPNTIWTEPVQCDLLITNPSDRPIFIQPIMLDAVYQIRKRHSTANKSDAMLISLFEYLGFPTSGDSFSRWADRISGKFTVEVQNPLLNPDPHWFGNGEWTVPTCCPIVILPKNGQATLRITFTSEYFSTISDENAVPPDDVSHGMLFIRNNLTAIEPVWLSARLGKPSLSFGIIRSKAAQSNQPESHSQFKVLHFDDPNKNISETANLLLEARWTRVRTRANFSNFSTEDNKCAWLSSTPILPPHTPSLGFDFSERSLWPFCSEGDDPRVISIANRQDLSSDHPHFSHPRSSHLIAREQRKEMLASLWVRRRLILLNTGDVPVSILGLMLASDRETLYDSLLTALDDSAVDRIFCRYSGYELSPCFVYPYKANTTLNSDIKVLPVLLQPGEHLPIEVRYRPDFMHTFLSVRLWTVAYPHSSNQPELSMPFQNSQFMSGFENRRSHLVALLEIIAVFPPSFLQTCMKTLPRPWVERILRICIITVLVLNLLVITLTGYMDGDRIYSAHLRIRERIDRLPFNANPDPSRVFSFGKLLSRESQSAEASQTSAEKISLNKKPKCSSGSSERLASKISPGFTPPQRVATASELPKVESTDLPPPARWSVLRKAAYYLFFSSPLLVLTLAKTLFSGVTSFGAVIWTKISSVGSIKVPFEVSRANLTEPRRTRRFGAELLFSHSPNKSEIVQDSDKGTVKFLFSASKYTSSRIQNPSSKFTGQEDVKALRNSRKSDGAKMNANQDARPSDYLKGPVRIERRKRANQPPLKVGNPTSEAVAVTAAELNGKLSSAQTVPSYDASGEESSNRTDNIETPMTEAEIAAAVRATMRLAEEACSQARRKSTQLKQRIREKRLISYSSASSSSGLDQDNGVVRTSSNAHLCSSKKTTESVPNDAEPDAACHSDSNANFTSEAPTKLEFDGKSKTLEGLPRLPLIGSLVADVSDNALRPEFELCWSSSHPHVHTDLPIVISRHSAAWSVWDEGVADIASVWDPISFAADTSEEGVDNSDEAMSRIAAETQAFANSLMHWLPEALDPDSIPPTREKLSKGKSCKQSRRFRNSFDIAHGHYSNRPINRESRHTCFSDLSKNQQIASSTHETGTSTNSRSHAVPVDQLDKNSTAEVGILAHLEPSVTETNNLDLCFRTPLEFTPPTKIMFDAFEAAASALEEAGLHPRCTSDLASCPICRAHLLTGVLTEEHPAENSDLYSQDPEQQDSVWPLTERSSHCFYELPQITENKRLCMLEHEGYNSIHSHLDLLSYSARDSAADESKTGDNGMAQNNFRVGTLEEYLKWPKFAGNLFHPCSLIFSNGSSGSYAEESNNAEHPPRSSDITFHPWRPISEISTTELLESLGLDETDRVLSFDSDFSYFKSSTHDPLTSVPDFSDTSAPHVSDMLDGSSETMENQIQHEWR
ncbi:unnamed protein product [Calicophoron daubneyi]|uniref:Transmembrane protein 131-like N-terminal domain-containing protein n=1 Tax=Calicophoron daubneyi TaxID=300641 RepID=A0AAV2TUM3_CALDB